MTPFFKYAAAGNEIIIFGLRSTLEFSLLSVYSKELAHLCLYQIDYYSKNEKGQCVYFLVCVQQQSCIIPKKVVY